MMSRINKAFFLMLFASGLNLPVQAQFGGGSGTQMDPYLITKAAQLDSIRYFLSAHFTQTADIDLGGSDSGGDFYNGGFGWTPIGSKASPFTGSFDGGGFTISNLYINRLGPYDHYGLFGYVDHDDDPENKGILIRVKITGADILARSHVGGLAGWTNGYVESSSVAGSVSGSTHVGGLIGTAWSGSRIHNSHSAASVSGSGSVGGLIGSSYDQIEKSYATGSISGGSGPSGGLVGNKKSGNMLNCFATGNISGVSTNGGIGGLVGSNEDTVATSYSMGLVTGSGSNVGGLVGLSASPSVYVLNSYWNTETSGQSSSHGGSGLTTTQMMQESQFSGFDFSGIWKIDEGNTFPFLINTAYRVLQMEITGAEGWRMLSSAFNGFTYINYLDTFWIQGISGSDSPSNGSANLIYWSESAQSWSPVSDVADIPSAGNGYLFFLYEDQDFDGNDEGFPKTVLLKGTEHQGSVNPSLTFTDTGNPSMDGWNLTGNPYAESIDWDASVGWSRTNLDGSFYIWNNSTGNYQSWNGITGTLANGGLIAPLQGFWVKATSANPTLAIGEDTKSSGGSLYKKAPISEIRFNLRAGELSSQAVLVFHETASQNKDKLDAYKLSPISTKYASFYSMLPDGTALDVNALPLEGFNEHEVSFGAEMFLEETTGSVQAVLDWSLENIPDEWELELKDEQQGLIYDLKTSVELSFELESQKAKTNSGTSVENVPSAPVIKEGKNKEGKDRFTLFIRSATAVGIDRGSSKPENFALHQNYPNPFNPATTITYQLKEAGNVRLEVFDMTGKRVAILIDGFRPAGEQKVQFEPKNLASGMYFYRLISAKNRVLTQKMMFVK